jgi:C1A family cysteine protease
MNSIEKKFTRNIVCILFIVGVLFLGTITIGVCLDNHVKNKTGLMEKYSYAGQDQMIIERDTSLFDAGTNKEGNRANNQELRLMNLSYFDKKIEVRTMKKEGFMPEENNNQSHQTNNFPLYAHLSKVYHTVQDNEKEVKTEQQRLYNKQDPYNDKQCRCAEYGNISSSPETEKLSQELASENVMRQHFTEIVTTIDSRNAQWKASFNPCVLRLMNQKTRGLGYIDEQILEYQTVTYDGTSPDNFDWRNVNGTDWTTSIKNQNDCGSCTAFGVLGALETIVQLHVGSPLSCDLSEGHLFFCGGGVCTNGMTISDATNYLKIFGVSDELCYPYSLKESGRRKMPPNWKERTVKIEHAPAIVCSFENIKNALLKYGPLVTSLYVHEDFYFYDGGIYSHVYGKFIGRHCVTIVGYNTQDNYLICKNSWGTQWGENGWFRIKYGQCNIGETTFYLSGISGNIQPFPPHNPTPSHTATKTMCNTTLTWDCTDPDNDTLTYNIYVGEGDNISRKDLTKIKHKNPYYQINNLKSNTTYSWKIIAEDTNGSQSESKIWKFTTREAIPPHINITHPQSGYLYWGKIKIPLPCKIPIIIGEIEVQGTAHDSSGIKDVKFYVNEIHRASISHEPYTWTWSEHSFGLTIYKLTIEAHDTLGNSAKDEVLARIFHPQKI